MESGSTATSTSTLTQQSHLSSLTSLIGSNTSTMVSSSQPYDVNSNDSNPSPTHLIHHHHHHNNLVQQNQHYTQSNGPLINQSSNMSMYQQTSNYFAPNLNASNAIGLPGSNMNQFYRPPSNSNVQLTSHNPHSISSIIDTSSSLKHDPKENVI